MSTRRLAVAAVTNDALSDQDIRTVEVPSVVNLWASSQNNGDQIGLRLDKTIIMDDGELNIESSADVIDADRDHMVFHTVVGRGTLRVPIPTVANEVQFMISVEPIL